MSFDVEREVPFQELRLVANGGAIVEGVLRVVTDGPLADDLDPPAETDLVANFSRSYGQGSITLMPRLTRQPDGFHDWRPPIVSLNIEPAFFDLGQARSYKGAPVRFRASLTNARLLSVHLRYPAASADPLPVIFANVSSVEGAATPVPAGLRLQMSGALDPTVAGDRVPALTGARFECDVLLPSSYLGAAGSKLAHISIRGGHDETRPWRAGGTGAQALALAGSLAFFEGRLRLPGQRTDIYADGPYLMSRVTADELTLHGASRLVMRSDGFAWPDRGSGGPELKLQLGHEDFARMLGNACSASLELRGTGIGQVDGQTGWVMEAGGPCTQEITACTLSLERSGSGAGIRFDLSGELAPLPPGHWAPSLGPRFTADFFVPEAYLLLRQWRIRNLVQDWRDRFGITFG